MEAEIEETGRTITFGHTTMDVQWFLEDRNSERNPGPQDHSDVNNTTTADLNDTVRETTQAIIPSRTPPHHWNNQHGNHKDLTHPHIQMSSTRRHP